MTASKQSKRWFKLFGTTILSAGFLFSHQVLAQDAGDGDEQAADTEILDEVTVTGSRIKRDENTNSPVPMVAMGEEQIELTGSINVYDILNELPQAGEGTTRGNTNFTVGSSGIQTINLRGLGSSRTLTLVNGRRWVGGVPGTGIVDLNSIPADLIERLEVVTGGASSVYGSDAVAGVVNVILKEDYEGMDVEAMYGQYMEGDGQTHSISATMGGNFFNDRGNAIFNARVDSQGSLLARDRAPYTGTDIFYVYWLGPGTEYFIDPAYSSYPPQGRFFTSGSTGDSTNMMTFDCSQRDEDSVLPSDDVVFWAAAGGGGACGFNRTHHRALEVPLDRYSAFAKTTFTLNDEHEAFAELSYTSVDSVSEFEPVPFNSEDIFGGLGNRGYHYDNPFVPVDIRDQAIADHMIDDDADPLTPDVLDPSWNGEIPFIRRLQELGNRGSQNTRNTFRIALGTQGQLGSLDYDWYYQYGENDRTQISGAYNALNFRSALNAEVDGLGNVVCSDSADRAAGCAPINVFGVGSISPEAAAWVGYESMRLSKNTQQVLGANITGSFEVLGRDISFATGAEWREEYSDDNPDDLQQQGLHGGNVVPRTVGEYDVTGLYLEVLVPLVEEVPGFQNLSLEAAYRSDDYSTAGRVGASKIGLNWLVYDDLRFRAVFAESVRAPDISDLFAGEAQTFVSIVDPCEGLGDPAIEPTMDAQIVANCYMIPDVAATAANGSFDPDLGMIVPGFIYSQPDIQTISGFVGGNPNLTEETAETTTIGMVFTPGFAEGLAVSVDWYSIEIEDVIGSVSATRLINECFDSADFPNISQCDAHERFPGTGKLRYWYSYGVNQSRYQSEGFDLSATYVMEDIIPGSLRFNLLYTRRDTHTFQTTLASTPKDFVGEVGYNEDKYKLTILYEIGDFLVSLDNTIYGKSQDDVDFDRNDYVYNAISTVMYTDLQVRYFATDDLQLYVGIDNLFDEQPPYCPGCWNEPSPGSHYTGSQHRPWDSMFGYAGVKYSFGKD